MMQINIPAMINTDYINRVIETQEKSLIMKLRQINTDVNSDMLGKRRGEVKDHMRKHNIINDYIVILTLF